MNIQNYLVKERLAPPWQKTTKNTTVYKTPYRKLKTNQNEPPKERFEMFEKGG